MVKCKNREDEINYMEYRKRFSQLCRQAELQYYKATFDSGTNNMKQLWKNLNIVCSFNNNKRKSEFISKIMDKGREITDPYDISMFLNSYFSTVGERLLQQSTRNNKPKISPSVFHDKPVMDSMFCWPVDSEEIRQLIYNLKISKLPGYDNIGASLIKDVVAGLVRPLAYIYNLSIETRIFHENLKIAKVIPAYKKGDACMASNYRLISLIKCI